MCRRGIRAVVLITDPPDRGSISCWVKHNRSRYTAGVRLLVIEDYAPLREALARGLRDAGYAVDATGSGSDGLWYAENHPYDAVILDIMLPGLDGFAILRRLRGAGNATRVLVLTARDAVADRVTGLDLGADDYLVKPFAFDELLARVRALVRRHYDQLDPVLRI